MKKKKQRKNTKIQLNPRIQYTAIVNTIPINSKQHTSNI